MPSSSDSSKPRRPGPEIRSDIVDVFVFRITSRYQSNSIEFLQMRRAQGALSGSWHPVMGHVEWLAEGQSETAVETARRELTEETGFHFGQKKDETLKVLGFWQLELVNTYYLASHECIVMSPGFAVQVASTAEPVLDPSHDDYRWIPMDRVQQTFLWPGHREAITHIVNDILASDNLLAEHLVLPIGKDVSDG